MESNYLCTETVVSMNKAYLIGIKTMDIGHRDHAGNIRLFAFSQFRSETKTIFAEEHQGKFYTLPIGNS